MGARGPKPGFKRAAVAAARKAAAFVSPGVVTSQDEAAALPAAHRENPAKLGGEALRHLGSRRGLAHSDMAAMSDEKLREQLKYITYRQYSEQEA